MPDLSTVCSTCNGRKVLVDPLTGAEEPYTCPDCGGSGKAKDRIAELGDRDYCPKSKRVDGMKHSWRFWGDDPYLFCHWCGELRDSMSGKTIQGVKINHEGLVEHVV